MTQEDKFHFPADIHLEENPLAEAWLEVRWKLPNRSGQPPQLDPFPFALGVFRNSIKAKYKEIIALSPRVEIPFDEMLPQIVKYQFWTEKDTWPVIQIGPGIATVNFTRPYTWKIFREQAIYLREQLINAYGESELSVTNLFLRYRNILSFDFKGSDFLGYINDNLNTQVSLPAYIPGKVVKTSWPTDFSMALTYDLSEPLGRGVIRIGTGLRKDTQPENQPVSVFELEVRSENDENNDIWTSPQKFTTWLDQAHAVTHEWFFSLIDGQLRNHYEGGKSS